MTNRRTVIEVLKAAREYLEEKGIENARGDATSLVGKALGLTRVELFLQHDRPLSDPELETMRDLLRRRARHEPLQLLLGYVEFCGAEIEVTPGLLIPRPETELMTALVIEHIRNGNGSRAVRVLDLGAGSGCIGIAIAREIPTCTVDALDADYEAVTCTQRNSVRNGVDTRVRAILGDIFSMRLPEVLAPPYDVIVSNPPYVTRGEHTHLAAEVRVYERRQALVSGATGLEFYERIAKLLPSLAHPESLVALEIGYGQENAVRELLRPVLHSVTVHPDLAGVARIITGQVISNSNNL